MNQIMIYAPLFVIMVVLTVVITLVMHLIILTMNGMNTMIVIVLVLTNQLLKTLKHMFYFIGKIYS